MPATPFFVGLYHAHKYIKLVILWMVLFCVDGLRPMFLGLIFKG